MKRVASAVLVVLAMCQAPEAKRVPGGAGANIGNRASVVELHGGSGMFTGTPCLLPRSQCPGPLPVPSHEGR
jgi:hypothetical protein